MADESIQILNVDEPVLDDNLASSITTTPASAIDNSSIQMDGPPDRLKMPEVSIHIRNDKPIVDDNPTSVDTTSAAIDNYAQKDKYPNRVDNWIIVGWALMIFFLGLVTLGFPCNGVHDYLYNEAFITYIVMLILELGIWVPMCLHISPSKDQLKKTKLFLPASFMFFNHVSNIIEQIISSIHYLNHGKLLIFINLFCGVVSFSMISALFWLIIDLKKEGIKWKHLSLGCKAALSATLLNISVFQLIVKKNFLHFSLFAILRDVIDLIDLIIRTLHNREEHS